MRAHAVTPRPAHGARAHPPHGHLLGRRDGGAAADFSRRRRSPSSIAVSSPNKPNDLKPSTGWASGLMKRLSIFTNSGEKKEVEVEEKDDENHSASVVDDGCNDDSKIDDDDSREPPAVQPIEEQSGVGWGRGFPATTTDQPKEEVIISSSGSSTMAEEEEEEEESEDAEEERRRKIDAVKQGTASLYEAVEKAGVQYISPGAVELLIEEHQKQYDVHGDQDVP